MTPALLPQYRQVPAADFRRAESGIASSGFPSGAYSPVLDFQLLGSEYYRALQVHMAVFVRRLRNLPDAHGPNVASFFKAVLIGLYRPMSGSNVRSASFAFSIASVMSGKTELLDARTTV